MWAADKDAMSSSLLVHDSILRGATEGNDGYVFTTAGDSFAAALGRASDALRAATEGPNCGSQPTHDRRRFITYRSPGVRGRPLSFTPSLRAVRSELFPLAAR